MARRSLLSRWSRPEPRTVITPFLVSGTAHLVRPQFFHPIMPEALPRHRELIYLSGVAELVCGAGLLAKQRWAGPASAALLLAVWPANLKMALDVTRSAGSGPLDRAKVAGAWLRMPMQIPMINAALRAARRP